MISNGLQWLLERFLSTNWLPNLSKNSGLNWFDSLHLECFERLKQNLIKTQPFVLVLAPPWIGSILLKSKTILNIFANLRHCLSSPPTIKYYKPFFSKRWTSLLTYLWSRIKAFRIVYQEFSASVQAVRHNYCVPFNCLGLITSKL